MAKSVIYLPGLNGIRAIAALSVVISHITLSLGEFGLSPSLFGVDVFGKPLGLRLGEYGVSIFFCLSGFLITYLLLAEKEIKGVQVNKFYLRRIFRIWPLYYLYLFVAVSIILKLKLEFNTGSFLCYFFYAANIPFILHTTLPFLNHYWSLGVEEQFYLFWPWIIKKLKKGMVIILGVAVAVVIIIKLLVHHYFLNSVLDLFFVVNRFHCMVIGAIGAILYKQHDVFFLKYTDNKAAQTVAWIIIVLSAANVFTVASIINNEIISTVTVVLIIGQINKRNRFINLEIPVLDFLGKISYGIYVIHPLAILAASVLVSGLRVAAPIKYILVYSSISSITIILAYLSFRYFESYFLRIKSRYSVIESRNTKEEGRIV